MYRQASNLTDLIFNPLRTLRACRTSIVMLGLSLAVLSPAAAQRMTFLPPTTLPPAVIPPLKPIEHPNDGQSGIKIDPSSDTITMADGTILSLSSMRDMFAQQEMQLNKEGYSLFDPNAPIVELAPALDYDQLEKQRDALLSQKAVPSDPMAPEPNVTYFSRNYPWSWSAGDPGFFQVSLYANLSVIAASDNLSASAEGRADGAVLSHGFNIARAYASASSRQGNLNANFTFQVLGNYLINWSATQPVSWTWSQSWQKEVAAPYSIWLGPIPVSGRVGIRGGIGVSLNLGLYGATVKGGVTPNVNTSGFAEAGVDIWFASAGVGGSLTFLSCSFPNEAGVYLQFDAYGRPQLVTNVKSHIDMNTLSGNFYVWTRLFSNYRYWTLWSWPGVQWGGDLYNDTHVINL